MFDYTKVAWKQIESDFKKLAFICNICTQLLYIAYLVYALFTKTGFFSANIILLILSIAYFAFFLYATQQELKKKTRKIIKRIYKRCKQLIKVFTLGILLYGLWFTAKDVSPISLIFTVFMVIGFILDVLLEIIVNYLVNRVNLMMEGLKTDWDNAKKPVTTVGNFFKKIAGKEIPEEPAPTQERLFLDEKVEEMREDKHNQKLEEKFLATQEKQRKKEEKRAAKLAKKNKAVNQADEEIAADEG